MLNRIFATFTLSSLLVTIPALIPLRSNQAIAQIPQETNANKTDQPTAISASKRALIKELLEITGSDKSAQQIMDSMVRAELPKLVSTILEQVPLLDSDRPEIQQQFSNVVSQMAVKYRDRVAKKINLGKLIEQVSYPIYDKYFTEPELRDILNFYKSSTGKKAIAVLPQVVGDSLSRTNEILMPQMTKIMGEVIAEELLTLIKNR
ncbi:MAG: hypothetical protein AUK48_08335 [Oscillatoriales cyanobacterium CG2_30_44_21]|nr:MAG: hypothetical protein AUK48_08335 [Oscillatoriales cyanobacterium CG2_30_44_21]